jgi:phosphatidylserine decarboxylase
MAIHNEGKKPLIRIFIVLLLINVVITYFLPDTLFAVIVLAVSLILFGLSMNFYKKPNREYKGDLHGLVNAPTDGRIVAIEKVFEKDFFNDERIQISIFMTFFNAHSNWIPVSGKVVHCSHVPGNFYAAYLPKSSTENRAIYFCHGKIFGIGCCRVTCRSDTILIYSYFFKEACR